MLYWIMYGVSVTAYFIMLLINRSTMKELKRHGDYWYKQCLKADQYIFDNCSEEDKWVWLGKIRESRNSFAADHTHPGADSTAQPGDHLDNPGATRR